MIFTLKLFHEFEMNIVRKYYNGQSTKLCRTEIQINIVCSVACQPRQRQASFLEDLEEFSSGWS